MIRKATEDSIENIIAGIPEAELRKLVAGLAKGDIGLRNKIVADYAPQIIKGRLAQFKQQVDKVVKENEDRHGLIGYLEAFIPKKQYRDAIMMACYIFRVLGGLP